MLYCKIYHPKPETFGIWIPYHGFRILFCQWKLTPNSGFLELYSGFQSPGFRIPESRIPSREAKLNVVTQTQVTTKVFFSLL